MMVVLSLLVTRSTTTTKTAKIMMMASSRSYWKKVGRTSSSFDSSSSNSTLCFTRSTSSSSSSSGTSSSSLSSSSLNNNESTTKTKTTKITTDEGVIIYQSNDPTSSCSKDGHGLVWGSVLWPSGISLAKYLKWEQIQQQQQRQNQSETTPPTTTRYNNILELGCGTGIVGLTCAKLNLAQNQIILTDSEISYLGPLIRQSIDANNFNFNNTNNNNSNRTAATTTTKIIRIHELDWKDTSTFLSTTNNNNDEMKFDLIVAADVLYSGMDKLFARVLASHLSKNNNNNNNDDDDDDDSCCCSCSSSEEEESSRPRVNQQPVALVACPYRKDSPLKGFFDACIKLGLSIERLESKVDGSAVGFGGGDFDDDDDTSSGGNNDVIGVEEIFHNSHFVPLVVTEEEEKSKSKSRLLEEVITKPTFDSTFNTKYKIQIFRLKRITGSPEDARNIRRVSRI